MRWHVLRALLVVVLLLWVLGAIGSFYPHGQGPWWFVFATIAGIVVLGWLWRFVKRS